MADVSPPNLPAPRALEPGVLRATLAGVPFAVLGASGTVAVSALTAIYTRSYLPWSVIGMVALFWSAAAAVAALAAAGVASPFMIFLRGRGRLAVMPAVVVAGCFLANALVTKGAIAGSDSIGKIVFLNVYFITAWAILLGVITGVLVIQSKRTGDWGVTFVMLLSVLVSAGGAYFIWKQAGAFALVIGPLALSVIVIAVIDRVPSAALRAAAVGAVAVLYAAALFLAAEIGGQKPLTAIERGVAADPGRAAKLAGRPNVIIITIDTGRADHMSLYGYRFPTTPYLERLAADCQFYPNGVATDSCTLPSHASLFTGMYPRAHGAHRDPTASGSGALAALDPSRTTLATYLSREGYDTAGIVANHSRLCRQLGVDQGFSYYHDMPRMLIVTPGGAPVLEYGVDAVDRLLGKNGKLLQTYLDGRTVTRLATDWIEGKGRTPFFLFINYMDAHYPYSGPPPFDSIDGPGIAYRHVLKLTPWSAFFKKYMRTGEGLTPELLREIVNQYDGGLAYADHWLGRFIEMLKVRGLYDNTLIVVTCDHGEFFSEHGLLKHGDEIYEEGVKIPILVKYPRGAHAGEVKGERVSILDIFATVFDVLKLPMPTVTAQPLDTVSHAIMTENYSPGIQREKPDSQIKRALTVFYSGDYKYTHSTTGRNELYDLAADPGELKNLVTEKPEIAARMEAEAGEYLAKTPAFVPAKSATGSRQYGDQSAMPDSPDMAE
jgi:arylsulfatase A-like enzyme